MSEGKIYVAVERGELERLRKIEAERNSNEQLAKEFSAPGTLKNLLLRLGFMPDNEEVAERIIRDIIAENERLQRQRL